MTDKPEDPSVSLFREYIKVESVQPNPDYDGCIKFLSAQAEIMDLPYQVCVLILLIDFHPLFNPSIS